MIEAVSILVCSVLLLLTLFQISLIFGAPLGRFAWGGAHTVLPTNLRISSAMSILIYAAIAYVVLAKAGMIGSPLSGNTLDVAMWVLAVYFFSGIILNALSRSKSERMVMTPIALILAVSCFIIALE